MALPVLKLLPFVFFEAVHWLVLSAFCQVLGPGGGDGFVAFLVGGPDRDDGHCEEDETDCDGCFLGEDESG